MLLRWISVIAILASISSCSQPRTPPQSFSSVERGAISVQSHPIEFNGQNLIVRIRTTSDDTLRVLFDTGGKGLLLCRDALDLCPDAKWEEDVRVFIENRWIMGKTSRIRSLRWDGETLSNVVATVVEREDVKLFRRGELDGLMGLGVTSSASVAIDYLAAEIHLLEDGAILPWGSPKSVVPLLWQGHIPCIQASLGNTAGLFALDTGSANVVDPGFWQKANLPEAKRTVTPEGESIEKAWLPEVRIGTFSVQGMAAIRQKPASSGAAYDGILGSLFLAFAGRVRLDLRTNVVAFYFEGPEDAWKYLEKEASMNHAWANLGLYRLSGLRSPQPSDDQRREWLSRAARSGSGVAAYALGIACLAGDLGLKKNYEPAVEFFSQASSSGIPQAQSQLGSMYREGKGTPVDPVRANALTRKAAQAGELDAQTELGTVLTFGGSGVEKNPIEGFRWLMVAARKGQSVAQSNVGVAYKQGLGVVKDPEKAIEWYLKAAEQRNASAMFNLGNAFKEGINGQVDMAKAKEWYRKAADNGHGGAAQALKELKQ